MNLLNILGINDAVAQATTTATTTAPAAGHSAEGGLLSLLPTLIIFVVVFYLLLIRPQSKRAKEHRKLIESIAKEDEVVTTGGIAGKIADIQDNFVVIKVANNVEMSFQKNAIAMVLPKGTLKLV